MKGPDLKALRQRSGLRGYELAKLLELSPETISRYETGKVPVPKTVELATRYLCQSSLSAADPPEVALVKALKTLLKDE